MKKANIYHDNNNVWYAALWINGEFDACHTLEATSEADARQECVETFGGECVIKRVDDVIRGRISLS